MRIITNTNIIVDDFSYCKSFPANTFIHFLTHFHADHWDGLTPLWDYSPIYTTQITKKFILNKFPKINNIIECKYNTEYTLQIGCQQQKKFIIKFYFFDAKHIPGSAMILFDGYMGRILFTGDFRYNFQMITQNPILFPQQLRKSRIKDKGNVGTDQQYIQSQTGISIRIDQMIFDNTYCNQMFKFQKQEKVLQKMIKIITENQGKKILIAMGALGKEKLLYSLSIHFQTLICITQQKLNQIKISGGPSHIFTTNEEDSFIILIKKRHRKKRIEEQINKNTNFICIDTDFLMLDHKAPDKLNYMVPYSLHSNFQQLCKIVKLIKPCILKKIVIPYQKFRSVKYSLKIDNRLMLAKYIDKLQNIEKSKSGYSYLVKKFTDIGNLSEKYLKWMKPHLQQSLMKTLGIKDPDHNLRKRKLNLQQQQLSDNIKSKKESLSQIANKLKATHQNQNIKEMFSKQNQQKQQKEFNKLYESLFQL